LGLRVFQDSVLNRQQTATAMGMGALGNSKKNN
jgi:hypothetical protein